MLSSGLCNKLEGAGFPLWMHPVNDRESDAVDARDVYEASQRWRAAAARLTWHCSRPAKSAGPEASFDPV